MTVLLQLEVVSYHIYDIVNYSNRMHNFCVKYHGASQVFQGKFTHDGPLHLKSTLPLGDFP